MVADLHEIDNNGLGNCGYHAYAYSMMYYLRSLQDPSSDELSQEAQNVFKLLGLYDTSEKVKQKNERDLKTLTDYLTEPSAKGNGLFINDKDRDLEAALSPRLRELNARHVIDEFKKRPHASADIYSPAIYYFRVALKGEDETKALVGDFDIALEAHEFGDSEFSKTPGLKDGLTAFAQKQAATIAGEYARRKDETLDDRYANYLKHRPTPVKTKEAYSKELATHLSKVKLSELYAEYLNSQTPAVKTYDEYVKDLSSDSDEMNPDESYIQYLKSQKPPVSTYEEFEKDVASHLLDEKLEQLYVEYLQSHKFSVLTKSEFAKDEFYAGVVLEEILHEQILTFFSNQDEKWLQAFYDRINTNYVWATTEKLADLNIIVTGERRVKKTVVDSDDLWVVEHDTPIQYKMYQNGVDRTREVHSHNIVLNNLGGGHFTSLIPPEILLKNAMLDLQLKIKESENETLSKNVVELTKLTQVYTEVDALRDECQHRDTYLLSGFLQSELNKQMMALYHSELKSALKKDKPIDLEKSVSYQKTTKFVADMKTIDYRAINTLCVSIEKKISEKKLDTESKKQVNEFKDALIQLVHDDMRRSSKGQEMLNIALALENLAALDKKLDSYDNKNIVGFKDGITEQRGAARLLVKDKPEPKTKPREDKKDEQKGDKKSSQSKQPIVDDKKSSTATKSDKQESTQEFDISEENLKLLVAKSVLAYKTHSHKIWFSLFHRHGGTGRKRADDFYAQILKSGNRMKDILNFLADDSNGNTNPHSFRTYLLKKVLENGGLHFDEKYTDEDAKLKNVSDHFNQYLANVKERYAPILEQPSPVISTL
jgi:hypothetical protein